MKELNINDCTKDKTNTLYNYLFTILCSIGFSPSNFGMKYLIKLTIFYHFNFDKDLILEALYDDYISYTKDSIKKANLRTNINSLALNINTNLAQNNFKSIFNIEYDPSFTTVKNIIILLNNLIK